MSNFLNDLHGKSVKVIFDNDPSYYYQGRATVESDYEKGNEIARFTLTINAEPYKYSNQSTTEPWLWDPFSFVDGVMRYYNQLPSGRARPNPGVGQRDAGNPGIYCKCGHASRIWRENLRSGRRQQQNLRHCAYEPGLHADFYRHGGPYR